MAPPGCTEPQQDLARHKGYGTSYLQRQECGQRRIRPPSPRHLGTTNDEQTRAAVHVPDQRGGGWTVEQPRTRIDQQHHVLSLQNSRIPRAAVERVRLPLNQGLDDPTRIRA